MQYISILRGINVSGQKKIVMAELRKLYESLGFTDVQTYIQSGNIVFQFKKETDVKLAHKIETAIEKQFGFEVPVIIRTKEELEHISSDNPFLKQKNIDVE